MTLLGPGHESAAIAYLNTWRVFHPPPVWSAATLTTTVPADMEDKRNSLSFMCSCVSLETDRTGSIIFQKSLDNTSSPQFSVIPLIYRGNTVLCMIVENQHSFYSLFSSKRINNFVFFGQTFRNVKPTLVKLKQLPIHKSLASVHLEITEYSIFSIVLNQSR